MKSIKERLFFYIGIMFFVVLPIVALAGVVPPGEDPPSGCPGDYNLALGTHISGGIVETWYNDGYALYISTVSERVWGNYYNTDLNIYFEDFTSLSMATVKVDLSGWDETIGNPKFRVKHSHGWHSLINIYNGMNNVNVPDGVVKMARICYSRTYYYSAWGPQDSGLYIDLVQFFQ